METASIASAIANWVILSFFVFRLLPEQCKVNKNCSTYLLTYVYMDKKWLIMCCKNKPCFNHKVVTLVTDRLKKQWLCVANYIRQPQRKLPRQSYNQSLTVSNHWTSVKGHSCLYQRECNNNHDLATTEHPWQSCQLLSKPFSGFPVGCCINREKGYLLPTWCYQLELLFSELKLVTDNLSLYLSKPLYYWSVVVVTTSHMFQGSVVPMIWVQVAYAISL